MSSEVIVVGAGVAGLQCARRLRECGREVLILDKARGVGGRCATRRLDEHRADFGVLFLHGHEPRFWEVVEEMGPGERIEGWPLRIRDTGPPCQPEAFAPYERRVALRAGVSAFAKHLARDLIVRLRTRVTGLRRTDEALVLSVENGEESGEELSARTVVLAQPLEQAGALLQALGGEEVEAAQAVLGLFASMPCLTLIAGYPADVARLDWDLCYPSDGDGLMLISNESSKRDTGDHLILVYQAPARWSREHLEEEPAVWSEALLQEAAARLGGWAAEPSFTHPHRWRYGRVDRGSELTSPMVIPLPGGLRIGLAGDIFAPGGGLQASWLAGDRLAERLQEGATA